MRLGKQGILVLLLCLLTGCSGRTSGPEQHALDFRTSMMTGDCSFTAQITADYGEMVYQFTMDCRTEGDQTHLQVVAPDAIAGIAAVVSEDGTQLQFDGAELDLGKLANGNVAPVTSPWLLTDCWLDAYIAWTGRDGDLERVTYLRGYHEAELTVDTWFSKGIPIHAEVLHDGVRCLTIEISDFQIIGS